MRCSPQEASQQTGISHSEPRQNQTPKLQAAQSSNSAPEILEIWYLNFPQECMTILKEARWPTTCVCYAAKWKRFAHYCILKQLDPLKPSVQDIILFCYLLHLQKLGQAYTSRHLPLAS